MHQISPIFFAEKSASWTLWKKSDEELARLLIQTQGWREAHDNQDRAVEANILDEIVTRLWPAYGNPDIDPEDLGI